MMDVHCDKNDMRAHARTPPAVQLGMMIWGVRGLPPIFWKLCSAIVKMQIAYKDYLDTALLRRAAYTRPFRGKKSQFYDILIKEHELQSHNSAL